MTYTKMNETATMPASLKLAADPDPMDYMASFALDPQLGGVVAPQQLATADTQFNMTATAWDPSFDLGMGSLQELDAAADADASMDDSLSPLDTTPPSTASSSDAKKAPKAKSAKKTAAAGADKKQRSQSLKRNRIAASKCRQKKKVWQSNLEEHKSELEAQHTQLQREYNNLLSEASILKNHLMDHASCHDDRIDRWIESEAMRFVGRASQRAGSVGGGKIALRNGTSMQTSPVQTSPTMQASPTMPTGLPSPPEAQLKVEGINYDHMTDGMFFQEAM